MKRKDIDIICIEFNAICIYKFGNNNSINDIDLVIVSNSFEGISIYKRKLLIKKNNNKIDPICLTEIEFERFKISKSSLWKELLEKGDLIYGVEKRYN